jgi:L-aminopeptidase/D-esterase-like protein
LHRALVVLAVLAAPALHAETRGLTAVPGVKVGHFTLSERPTGCTVILTEAGATAGVDVRGGAPGTRATDLLRPENIVQQVHGIVLSGGSAFGLDTATGVMRYLEEKGVGFDVGVAHVPIVPAAVIFDLPVGGKSGVRPGADCGYRAAQAASSGTVAEGSVGAGAGATVGKSAGMGQAMKAGIGTASITTADGLIVAALVVVNAAGDIVDPATGRVIAGLRTPDGKGLADARKVARAGLFGVSFQAPRPVENTTLGVIATNAALTKAQAQKVAQMAHDGLARAISPAHTPVDGDTIFTLATGGRAGEANVGQIGALAAEVMADAILRAASQATGLPGLPAARDLAATPLR